MPKLILPRSDQDRISLLDKCITSAKSISDPDQKYLSDNFILKIVAFEYKFKSNHVEITSSFAQLGKETREKSEVIRDLDLTIRDFYEVLRRRKRRSKQPAEIFTLYDLRLNGYNPKLTQQTDVLIAAKAIVKGDKNAVKAGYPPMQNPSAKEVADLLKKAQKERQDLLPADREYDEFQHQQQAMRKEADALIREIAAQLRFALRRNAPSNQRRLMKHYGFQYQI